MRHALFFSCFLWAAALPGFGQLGDRRGEVQSPLPTHLRPPPSPPLSPQEALETFQLAPGFRIELVASEPMVQDPVAMTFDERGRIWVVEMRNYMPNLRAEGENEPVGRISILEDTDGDGKADRSTVFLDSLIQPRAVARFQGGALFVSANKLWFAPDENRDDKPDEVRVIDPDYIIGGNVEHQPNGLLLGLDNWFYSANAQFRYRFVDGQWQKQRTELRGQWGISQDNYGRLFYNVNDSQLRGDVTPPNYMSRNPHFKSSAGLNLLVSTNQRIFSIRMNTGVNRGYRAGILDEHGRLKEFTSACAPVIYRGDQFPDDFQGNAFVCEPGANLIKRNLVFDGGLQLTSRQAYGKSEFLASTDERFRPVNACVGPDGALYVVDMYRGIIQHRAFITTHLRNEIVSRELDQHIHLGRIYRVVYAGGKNRPRPALAEADSSELVRHLSHPNGWWRDTAQRLLVERADRAVTPSLIELATDAHAQPLGRIHALWTLEALKPASFDPLWAALEDAHPKVQTAAVRVLEALASGKAERENRLIERLAAASQRAPAEAQFQIALSAGTFGNRRVLDILARIVTRYADSLLIRDAILSSLANREWVFLQKLLADETWRSDGTGRPAVLQALASAIVKERNPAHVAALLELAAGEGAETVWRQRALMAGVAENVATRFWQPIAFPEKPASLDRLEASPDPFVAGQTRAVAKLFAWPGHQPARAPSSRFRPLSPEERDLMRIGKEQFTAICAACHGMNGEGIAALAPPLAGSEWVTGLEERLIRIILQGLEGPVHVGGATYEPPMTLRDMPPLDALDDQKIAAVVTYIRNEWGHQAPAVRVERVAAVRKATAGRQTPWTEEELLGLSSETSGADR